jgi:hypothetical protein
MKFISFGVAVASVLPFAIASYDPAQTQISLKLSNVTYCNYQNYMTHNFTGVLEGF